MTIKNFSNQNRQTKTIAKKLGLSAKQREQLHDHVSGMEWDYQQILEEA